MKKEKTITFSIVLIAFISLIFNYYFYKENNNFKNRISSEYQVTVRKTLFELNKNYAEFWTNELKKENSEVLLERHIGKLHSLSEQYHKMNAKVSIIGTKLDIISKHLYELKGAVDRQERIEEQKEVINAQVGFIIEVLQEIENDFGENKKKWFIKLSDPNSETSNRVWKRYKEFESKNNISNK